VPMPSAKKRPTRRRAGRARGFMVICRLRPAALALSRPEAGTRVRAARRRVGTATRPARTRHGSRAA
jgi:hypothetical protein